MAGNAMHVKAIGVALCCVMKAWVAIVDRSCWGLMAASLLVAIVDRLCWGLMVASLLVAIVDTLCWGLMVASLLVAIVGVGRFC